MASHALIPIPKTNMTTRDATLADVPFIDRLQKLHGNAVGFMRTSWIEEKIRKGQVIVAEESITADIADNTDEKSDLNSSAPSVSSAVQVPLGYCMGVDRYFKRDDVGIIYQMNVEPGRQRGFIGATLLKAMFDRAAYGCRLFCCWCAQDLQAANRFWEAMGFVPLAYRAGSEKKARVHIFWQKRIREDDVIAPFWFPAKTDAGAMGADRIVLPIPAGLRWWDKMPVMVGAGSSELVVGSEERRPRSLPTTNSQPPTPAPVRRMQFGPPGAMPVVVEAKAPEAPTPAAVKVKKPKVKADPKMIAAARELRDRWLEHVNSGKMGIEDAGKYDVSRALPDVTTSMMPERPTLLLPAA